MESMFEDFFAPAATSGARWSGDGAVSPKLKVSESEQAFQVKAEMPGVNKEDIKVAIDHQCVSIEAESQREEQKREGDSVIYTERSANKFMRTFVLPSEVDDASAEAHLKNGILCQTLPKKQGSGAKQIPIQ